MKYKLGDVIKKAPQKVCGEDAHPVLSITKERGLVLQSDRFKKQIASVDQSKYLVVKRGQLVLSIHLDEGVLGVQDVVEEGIVSPAYKVWNVDTEVVRLKYLEWLLKSNHCVEYYKSKAQSSVAGRCNINDKDLLQMEVSIPTFEEQDKALLLIEKTSAIIEGRKKELQKLDELIKARFIEMFNGRYPLITLGDEIKTTSGGTPSRKNDEYYVGGTIPWLTSGEVNLGFIDATQNFITQAGLDNSSAKWVPENSVVIAMYGATAGKVGVIRIPVTTNQAVCTLLPNPEYETLYLYYACKNKENWMLSKCAGAAQPNISQTIIKEMQIEKPPLDVQRHFSNIAEQSDKSKSICQKKLALYQELYDSLMQKYFGTI